MSDISRYDVVSQDRRRLQVSQTRNLLVFKVGTIVLNKVSSNSVSQTVTHNLGYVPAVQAYYTTDNINYTNIPFGTITAETYYFSIRATITDTTVVFTAELTDPSGVIDPSPDATYTVKYYIFREKAT